MKTKPKLKARYRLRNWSDYNANLRRRGSLTLWLDEDAVSGWIDAESMLPQKTHQKPHPARNRGQAHRGHPRTYSDAAIQCMLTMKAVYHLPLRATVGLVESVLQLMGHAELPVAHSSTLSRRAATLKVRLPVSRPKGPLHLVVDSSGLKVYGEGEWKVKKHGWTYHRSWIKMHLGVDADSNEHKNELRVLGVSASEVGDGQMLPQLLDAEKSPIDSVTGDGAYASHTCYEAVAARPERPLAVFSPQRERRRGQPPRPDRGHEEPEHKRHHVHRKTDGGEFKGYSLHTWKHGNCKGEGLPLDRDEHVRRIRQVGRRRWKEEVGYNKRSLVETAVFRMKTIFGSGVSARKMSTQMTEIFIRGAALNRMTALGMPDSYLVKIP